MTLQNLYILILIQTAEEGAETVIYVGLSSEVESSGYYFEDCAKLKSSSFSLDKSIQRRLATLTKQQLYNVIEHFNRTYPEFAVKQMLA